ncbi:prepilin-type N-terminal cleavage/methylation domain-containing protein [Patescibacteria group bacterium]|nr:prepilin-type N-terminal cleavage/methylation domain-containing protein [Patescibacteria group bacterium]
MPNKLKGNSGFTLIELLLVIAIIAILAATIFVALDPLKRFQDTRDARRWSEVEEMIHAIKIDQIDNRGKYLDAIANLPQNEVWMISATNTATTSCNVACAAVASTSACLDLSGLQDEGYLSAVPVSPSSPDIASDWSSDYTGYTIQKSGQYITITACEGEGGETITVQR